MRKLKMYVIRPDSEKGYMTYISDSLENLQKYVDGYIEVVTIAEDLVIICNEEGRIRNLDYCCEICGIMFYGTILICGKDGEEFSDIPMDIKEVRKYLGVK